MPHKPKQKLARHSARAAALREAKGKPPLPSAMAVVPNIPLHRQTPAQLDETRLWWEYRTQMADLPLEVRNWASENLSNVVAEIAGRAEP